MKASAKNISLAFFLVLTAVPLGAGLIYALLYSLGLTGILNNGFTLDHWQKLLLGGTFWRSLGFSVWVALVTMAVSVALALGAVLRWQRAFAGRFLSFLIYLPLVFPAMVVGFYTFQMLAKSGVLSRVSYQLGWISNLNQFPDWINDNWGIGIIVAHTFMATPFLIILFSNLYQNERLDESVKLAETLGASQRQITWRVTTPVLLNRAFATLVLYFIFVMSSYEIPLLLGSQSREMISVLTIRKLQRFNLNDIPQAYAISVLYGAVLITLVVNLLGKKCNGEFIRRKKSGS